MIPVDKPAGPTSHDVVDTARRALGERRIGHTGTLDPFASGLLLLCVGPATRLSEYLTGLPKAYVATTRLGESTDTLDSEGKITRRSDAWRALTESVVRQAFEAHVGEREQRPPVYSAKKVGGERLYEKARRGEQVDVEPVRVRIHGLVVDTVSLPEVSFSIRCSSGTYIRAVARDVGDALGVGAHLTALRRTAIGPHSVEDALASADLSDPSCVRAALLAPIEALNHMPRLEVDEAGAAALSHGRAVAAPAEAIRGAARRVTPVTEPFLGALGQSAHVPPGAAVTASLASPGNPRLQWDVDPPGDGDLVVVSRDGVLLAIAELDGGVARPRKVFRGA